MCTIRENFNLCEGCEQKTEPPYPMIKIRDPSMQIKNLEAKYSEQPQLVPGQNGESVADRKSVV